MPLAMIRAVSVALLSACRVGADEPVNGASGPCNEHDLTPATPTFCQPAEEKGSYGVRYWTMDAVDLCNHVSSGNCFTLDDMHCDGSPDHCLKWGKDAYFGRVILPEGVKLSGYGSWSCNGSPRFNTQGPTAEAEDHWDYNWRVDAFSLALEEGFSCDASSNPPVQRNEPCKPEDVIGSWSYLGFDIQTGDTRQYTLQIGFDSTETTTDQNSFTSSLTTSVSSGLEVEGVGSDKVELSSSMSKTISHSVSEAVTQSTHQTWDVTLTRAGSYWQFLINASTTHGCNEKEGYQIPLKDYINTPNTAKIPCCAPGTFKNVDDPWGDCIDGAPRLCDSSLNLV